MKKFLPLLVSVFFLQILAAQNTPVASNDTFNINKNNQALLPVLSNDFDVDGDSLKVSIFISPLHGTANVSGSLISYLPNFNYTGSDSLTYIVCDTTNRCDTAVLVLVINNVNNRPVAVNDTFSISRNNTATLPVLSNDYDPDGDPVTVSIIVNPLHGTASVSNNQVVYTPNSNYQGIDSVKYIVCDTAGCDTGVLVIFIGNYNNGPVAIDDFYNIPLNVLTALPVLSNDFDPHGSVLFITVAASPSQGIATVSGSVINYTPNIGYLGTDSFIYIICDTANRCDTATVYVTIGGTNSPPVANDDAFTFTDTLHTSLADVLANDTDPDGDLLRLSSVADIDGNNNLGTMSIDLASGSLLFTRNGTTCGTETFEYVVCDFSQCDTGRVSITVICPDNVFLTEGFSPDGDGINDKLVFRGLEYFSPATLKIFNRYGTGVYDTNDYKNDWDGTMKNGKALPDGTYFYILELPDKRRFNNYLIINR